MFQPTQFQKFIQKTVNFDVTQIPEILPFVTGVRLEGDQVQYTFVMEIRQKDSTIQKWDTEKDFVINQANFVDGQFIGDVNSWVAKFQIPAELVEAVSKVENYTDRLTGTISEKFKEVDFNSKKTYIDNIDLAIKEWQRGIDEKTKEKKQVTLEIQGMEDENDKFFELKRELKKKGLLD